MCYDGTFAAERMKVVRPALKICGMTSKRDLDFCLRSGVDFAGFNFYRGSKRFIQPEEACRIWANRDPGSTKAVGVVVNPGRSGLTSIVKGFPGLYGIQFHGAEPDDDLRWFHRAFPQLAIWRAAPVLSVSDINQALAKSRNVPVDLILFDSAGFGGAEGGVFGGSGQTFDWGVLQGVDIPIPFGIAGGIRPGLIAPLMEVSRKSGCSLLDIASGVEDSPGVKNHVAISQVIAGIDAGIL